MIVKKPDERFPTAPEGTFSAVCVDEIDLGKQTSTWNGKERERHVVRLVWQIDETDSDGKRYLIKQDYTASLDEKAKLRLHLVSWRGRDFTFDEEVAFDLETVVGAPCMISIVHNKGSQGGTFANLGAVMKLPRGMPPLVMDGYVRVKDRKTAAPVPAPISQPKQRPPVEEMPPNVFEANDDDVPF
jgi:hypothetical protein